MINQAPSPDEMIALAGCKAAADVDACLLALADRALDSPLGRKQDLELAFNCVRAVLMRLWNDGSDRARRHVAAGLLIRAQMLDHSDRQALAEADYEEIWLRFGDSSDPAIRVSVAPALLEAGELQQRLGNPRAAERWFRRLDRYADDPDPYIVRQVGSAEINIAHMLLERKQLTAATEKLASIRQRWETHPDYLLRRRIANLMLHIASSLGQLESHEDAALALFDDAISLAGVQLTPPLRHLASGAYRYKIDCLLRLGRFEDALDCAEDFEKWFTSLDAIENEHHDVQRLFEENRRHCFSLKAIGYFKLQRYSEALNAIDRSGVSSADMAEDMEKREEVCRDLSLRGRILIGLGRYEEANAQLDEMFEYSTKFGVEKMNGDMLASLGALSTCIKARDPNWF